MFKDCPDCCGEGEICYYCEEPSYSCVCEEDYEDFVICAECGGSGEVEIEGGDVI